MLLFVFVFLGFLFLGLGADLVIVVVVLVCRILERGGLAEVSRCLSMGILIWCKLGMIGSLRR